MPESFSCQKSNDNQGSLEFDVSQWSLGFEVLSIFTYDSMTTAIS